VKKAVIAVSVAVALTAGFVVLVKSPFANATNDKYLWCQSNFVSDGIVQPGTTFGPLSATVADTAQAMGLVAPDGSGDITTYWLNRYVGDGADDWGNPPPHPHWDAVYAKLASDPQFIEACDAAYAKRIP
jgi:hypothetical protein